MSCTVNIAGKQLSADEVIKSYLGSPERFDDVMLLAEESEEFIAGMPLRHQLDMAETIIAFMLRDINIFDSYDVDKKQRLSKKKIQSEFAKHKKTFTDKFNQVAAYGQKDVASESARKAGQYAQMMLDSYDTIENLAMRVLINKGLFSLSSGDVDTLLDALGENEFRNYNEDFQFERDLKDNMSEELKYFLAQIDSGKKTLFNYPLFMDMTEVYTTVRTILSGVYPDYDEMYNILLKESKHKPWLTEVIKRLSEDESIRNAFVTNMTSHPVSMLFLNPIKTFKDGKETIEWKFTESNRNTGGRIVMDNWMDAMINDTNLYYEDPLDGKHRIIGSNDPEGSPVITALLDKYKDPPRTKTTFKNFFRDIGIPLSDKAVEYIAKNGFIVMNTEYTIDSFIDPSSKLGMNKMLMDLKVLSSDRQAFEISSLMDTASSIIRTIAEIEFKVSDNIPLASFRSKDKSIGAHILNRYAVNRVRDLVQNKQLREDLKAMPYHNSNLLEMLDDPILQKEFSINYPDISQFIKGIDDSELRKLTPEEHMQAAIAGQQNGGYIVDKKARSAKMLYPTMSDKKNKYIISVPLHIEKDLNNYQFFNEDGSISQGIIDRLISSLIMPEYRRILAEQKIEHRNIDGYNVGRFKFFLFPELNSDNPLAYEQLYMEDESGIHLKPFSEDNRQFISDIVLKHLNKEFTEMSVRFRPVFEMVTGGSYIKMLESYGVRDEAVIPTAIMDYILSSVITNMNVTQLISGDPAMMFKKDINGSWENYAKRWAKDNAPGLEIDDTRDKSTGHRNFYNVLFANDIDVASDYLKHFENLGAGDGYGFNDKGIGEMSSTDAQTFISLKEWAHILFRKGDIKRTEYEHLLDAYKNDTNIDKALLKRITNVFKPVIVTDSIENGVERKVYIKMSSYPLIPELTKGLDIDDVRKMMKDKEIDLLAFKTAAKLGAPTTLHTLFSGEVSDESILKLPRYGFKIQQDIPQKDANLINRGTQFTKLLFNGVKDIEGMSELEKSYDNLYAELYEKKRQDLDNELRGEDGKLNFDKLNELIKDELIARKYDSGTLKYFAKIVNEEGKSDFAHPFYATPQRKRIEPVINALIDSRIRKTKFPGKSYVLASRAGYKTKAMTLEEYRKTGGELVFTSEYKFGENLAPQVFNKNTSQRAQVIVPWNFRDAKGDIIPMSRYMTGGMIDFDKIPRELLQIQGFRIPTQGLNSMSAAEIVGFLPEGMTDIVIAPAEYVTQMGSDFDVDKLYTYQRAYTVSEDGSLAITTREDNLEMGIINEIIDIQDKVLTNPDPKVQKAIVKKLDYGMFEEEGFFEKVGAEGKDRKVFLLPSQQMDNYIGAASAKDAVGLYSLASTFNALIQDVSGDKELDILWDADVLGLYGPKENFNKSLRTFGHIVASNNLSTVGVANKNSDRTKGDVISAVQSAAVDNENKRFLEKIGVTGETIRIPTAMAQLGFEEDIFGTLLNMPLVKLNGSMLSLSPKKFRQAFEELLLDKFNVEDVSELFDILKAVIEAPISDYQAAMRGENIPNKEYYDYAALYQLYSFNNLGQQLSEYQQLLNMDSSGLKKNFLEAITFDTKFQALIQNDDPILPFIGEIVASEEEGGKMMIDEDRWFKPTKIASIMFFNESRFVVDFLYSDPRLTIYKTRGFEKIRDEILSLYLEKAPSEIRMNEILGFYDSYIDKLDSALVKYMLSAEKSLYPNGSSKFQATVKDLEAQVRKVKNDKALKANAFLNILENNPAGEIIYRASRKTDDFSNTIEQAFEDLYRNNRFLPEINRDSRDFVLDLIRYNYLKDPFQRATNFSRFIPFRIIEKMGIPETLRSFDLNDETSLGYNAQQISSFTRQFIQNNPDLAPNYSDKVIWEKGKDEQIKLVLKSSGVGLNPAVPKIIRLGDVLFESTGSSFMRLTKLDNEYDITQPVIQTSVVLKSQKTAKFKHKLTPISPKVKDAYKHKLTRAIEKTDVKEVLRTIATSERTHFAQLASELLVHPKVEDILIAFNKVPLGRTSYLDHFNLIGINESRFTHESDSRKELILLHEFIHAFTKKAIVAYRNKEALTDAQKKSMDKLNALYTFFKDKTLDKKALAAFEKAQEDAKKAGQPFNPKADQAEILYAAKNLEEFLAMIMTSQSLQDHLRKSVAGNTSLWEKIKDAIFNILKTFGLVSEDSAKIVESAMEEVLSLIRNSDDIINPTAPKSAIFANIKEITPDNPLLDIC